MDDPIKVIYKYKNANRRIQYNMYVFVGFIHSSKVSKVLEKFKELNLFQTLTSLSDPDVKLMESTYGENWYEKFFNHYHLQFSIENIRKSKSKSKDIQSKYGKKWYEKHIEGFKLKKPIEYNYNQFVKEEREERIIKVRLAERKEEQEEDDVDYSTQQAATRAFARTMTLDGGNDINLSDTSFNLESSEIDSQLYVQNIRGSVQSPSSILSGGSQRNDKSFLVQSPSSILSGGQDDGDLLPLDEEMNVDYDALYADQIEEEKEDEVELPFTPADADEETIEDVVDESDEFDLEELEQMYKVLEEVEPDKDVNNTTKLINKILVDEADSNVAKHDIVPFDESGQNNMFEEELKNVIKKHYVYSQYLFKDDTIKTVKHKICASIALSESFVGNVKHQPRLLPSRQYLYSEYRYTEDKKEVIDNVMLGQKWIRRNELLNIDVVPNENIHVYENLRGNLRLLKDNMRKYGSKIKREEDENNLLLNYDEYITNNEIYMIDIYSEMGINYKEKVSIEQINNIFDVYVKIYFFQISKDHFQNIIDYLDIDNDDTKKSRQPEINRMQQISKVITNDLLLENEIVRNVESLKLTPKKYMGIFKDNYITQSVIHTNVMQIGEKLGGDEKRIDLFRIFDNFIVNEKYPFLEYQTLDGDLIFKFHEDHVKLDKNAMLSKWFENAPYGISFKIKLPESEKGGSKSMDDKYIAIGIRSSGRVEYKTQWKESDKATIDDIKDTYQYVLQLIRKINKENKKLQLSMPNPTDFKFAFINTIQQIELPNKFIINHNDLSDFARYFFPYVSLVIEPRKRKSRLKKAQEESKFGTYLRYKRIAKYDNEARIEHRIIYFLRNYEFNLQLLGNEISKQFNITEKQAIEQIEKVIQKYPMIKKSRKVLKKLENIPKYKPPGIGIDIQGKTRNRYKMRISGARNKAQLERMILFMNILIYLYVDTYLYKNKDRQKLLTTLKKLTNIAKRRNRVRDVVELEDAVTIKSMTKLDKERIGFKPEKGQNQWSRSCQNSGTDKRRQPKLISSEAELLAQGYLFNEKTNDYRKITKYEGKKVELTAAKLESDGSHIFYTCDPDENGEHMYVGFLSRSNNPSGLCMPCCFKKNPAQSKNAERRNYHLKCMGKMEKAIEKKKKIAGDKLYILQDTVKIQAGRFSFLPRILNIFMNNMLGHIRKIKNHYLVSSETGYFFKFGTDQSEFQFLNALGSAFDLTVDEIKGKVTEVLEKDKGGPLFTSLNNGDIRTQFQDHEKYIDYITNNEFLDMDLMHDLVVSPNVLTKDGVNMLIFDKRVTVTRDEFNKKRVKTDYILICTNIENMDNYYDPDRTTIMMIRDETFYYPIFFVTKRKTDRRIQIKKLFKLNEDKIINHILKYHKLSCSQSLFKEASVAFDIQNNAKTTYKRLIKLKKEFLPKYQIIDRRSKCKYLVTQNNTIVPVVPSGCIYNLRIVNDVKSAMDNLKSTIKRLNNLYKASKKEVKVKPIGIYYSEKRKNDFLVEAVMTNINLSVPVKQTEISARELQKISKELGIKNFLVQNISIYDKIDDAIDKEEIIVDDRMEEVGRRKYLQESYELFRYELSSYLETNKKMKESIENILENKKLDKDQKKNELKKLLFKISSKELFDLFKKMPQKGGDRLIHIYGKEKELEDYEIDNHRKLCSNLKKDQCSNSYHCHWTNNQCLFSINREMLVEFVGKVSEEIVQGDVKADEILQRENYYVSDIVDRNRFAPRDKQKIVKNDNWNINRILSEIFGKDNIPKIGRKKIVKSARNIEIENLENPLENLGNMYVQNIIPNNNSLFRAFSNGFYWLKNPLYDETYRNLGYYSPLQTDMANYIRSAVIDWTKSRANQKFIKDNLLKHFKVQNDFVKEYVIHISKNSGNATDYVTELIILSLIYNVTILVYNNFNKLIYVFDNGKFINTDKSLKKYDNMEAKRDAVNLKFIFMGNEKVPVNIQVLYYK